MITNTGEIVAVKQLILDSEEDLTAAAQIESEIEILTMLDHPNIVKVKGTQRYELCTLNVPENGVCSTQTALHILICLFRTNFSRLFVSQVPGSKLYVLSNYSITDS